MKSPFLETVKVKIVTSPVTTSGNIDFDFNDKSQYFIEKSQSFIGKHIRKHVNCPKNRNLNKWLTSFLYYVLVYNDFFFFFLICNVSELLVIILAFYDEFN